MSRSRSVRMLLAVAAVLMFAPVAAAQESRLGDTPDGAYNVDPFNSHVSNRSDQRRA